MPASPLSPVPLYCSHSIWARSPRVSKDTGSGPAPALRRERRGSTWAWEPPSRVLAGAVGAAGAAAGRELLPVLKMEAQAGGAGGWEAVQRSGGMAAAKEPRRGDGDEDEEEAVSAAAAAVWLRVRARPAKGGGSPGGIVTLGSRRPASGTAVGRERGKLS